MENGHSQGPETAPIDLAPIITDLSSGDFSTRRAAEQTLLKIGSRAFEALIVALDAAPNETGERIISVLELIWLQCPLPEADRLERQLESIRLAPGRYQADVARLLMAHHRLREERALRALRRLNAIVESMLDESAFALQIELGQLTKQPPTRVSQVILPKTWKGTSDDLWHLQRLAHLKSLVVFIVPGNGISDADRQRMTIGFPDMQVNERGEIFIGVIGSAIAFDNQPGCHITSVQPESPAEIAELQSGDVIHFVDGQEIKNFSELVNSLKKKRAYEPIELTVERFGQSLEVTLFGAPWESKQFPRPPMPPMSEPLIREPDGSLFLPFPER